ncbi:STAS domain-containing protein [Kitasatospora indigofera]|uniref:STAS domain-containing protein n=1 Tax=Kitasatospora indigofera TaxID=67307 RepID=UPI0036B472F5
MTGSAAGGYTVAVRESLVGPVVVVTGELDQDSAPDLHTAIGRALSLRPVPPVLVVDLAAVTFCDSSGLNALVQGRIEAERQSTVVHLARPAAAVTRLLEITGADRIFRIDTDVPARMPHTRDDD